jgi:maltose alpha-D-glucosyltransferase/alpha-amylase
MIRSFSYAAHTALAKQTSLRDKPENIYPLLYQWAQYWYVWVSGVFLNSYLDTMQQTNLLPKNPDHLKIILEAYLLEKAIYEVGYELNNRPDWLKVPLQGIQQIMKAEY